MSDTYEILIRISPRDWHDTNSTVPSSPAGVSIEGPITVSRLAANAGDLLGFALQVGKDVGVGMLANYIFARFSNRGPKRMLMESGKTCESLTIECDKILLFLEQAKSVKGNEESANGHVEMMRRKPR